MQSDHAAAVACNGTMPWGLPWGGGTGTFAAQLASRSLDRARPVKTTACRLCHAQVDVIIQQQQLPSMPSWVRVLFSTEEIAACQDLSWTQLRVSEFKAQMCFRFSAVWSSRTWPGQLGRHNNRSLLRPDRSCVSEDTVKECSQHIYSCSQQEPWANRGDHTQHHRVPPGSWCRLPSDFCPTTLPRLSPTCQARKHIGVH